ncbi:MAG TPA: 1-deoxy-D-xylulose-5-phosphate reductoisomerase [Candidatus Acidoferrales bacterium]|nr:1-deoxy-D-xylulose-5-phosphate reductoisomerase [Candidatus Acidoferrales bacterium]
MKTLTILGCTGSIGTSTLDVVRRNRHQYRVYGLVAGRNIELLTQQIQEFRPRVAAVATSDGLTRLYESLLSSGMARKDWPELLAGGQARVDCVRVGEVDTVISAIVGVAGLEATYEAVCLGKTVGLANKEVLVSAGALVMEAVQKHGGELLPVDSEHNGAHQCLRAGNRAQVSKLILTASGGPFRNTAAADLAFVTPEQALNHPTWRMGNRITIDCATLMNKGFEVIEACWLFDFAPSQVDVVIHPQSTVHAMIEFSDGSVLAQISATDMRMPIQYALTYPDRCEAPVPKIDWSQARHWEFSAPDHEKFPLLRVAYDCQEAGGSATCTLNAADEIAVEAFLHGQIRYPAIHEIVKETLDRIPARTPRSINDILEIDRESRVLARELVTARAASTVTA